MVVFAAPSQKLRPFLPDRKLPQEQEFMVIGACEPQVFLRQWNYGPRQCQEFSFSTQIDCKLLEYRNLTYLQLLQPSALQVELCNFMSLQILGFKVLWKKKFKTSLFQFFCVF